MIISLIAAMSKNNVIGLNNQMPWHLPADLKHFKALTLGKPVIMGRKTYDSIGKALPLRRNIVITRQANLQLNDADVMHSLDEALNTLSTETEIMIIGGGEIFKQAMPIATRMYLTYIEQHFDGDALFPKWNGDDWQLKAKESHPSDERNPYPYTFITLERKEKKL